MTLGRRPLVFIKYQIRSESDNVTDFAGIEMEWHF
jgi:hypothetical protein